MLSFRVDGGVFNYRVVGVLIQDEMVLVHRAPEDDFWALPGGRCEFGEASAAALRREFLEELGIEVQIDRLLWVVENFFGKPDPLYHEIAFYYLVGMQSPLPREVTFEGRKEDRDPPLVFRWATFAEIPKMRLYPTFLRGGLLHLPRQIAHIVHQDE